MAAEQKIIQDLDKAFAGLTVTLEALGKVIEANKAQQQEQIQYIEALKKAIGDSKEWKAFAEATNNVSQAQRTLAQQQKDALDIQKKEEQLKQQQIRTSEAARRAAEAQQKAQDKANRTSQQATSLYKQETDRLRELTQKAKEAAIQYGINSKQAKALAKEQQALDRRIKEVDKSLGIHNRNVGNYPKLIGKSLLAVTGLTVGLSGIVSMFKESINKSIEFEKKNAELASVLGITTKETIALQKEARRLGVESGLGASKITELQSELARLGKSEDEIIDMTQGVVNASIAMGSSAGDTASLVAAMLNTFQLEASKSTDIADMMAASADKSALSFSYLQKALPTVGGAAKAAGYNFQQVVAMLGKLSDSGIDASTAGTSLRNILISVANEGITLDDALSQIVNSQDKLTTATEMFGKQAAVAAISLAENKDGLKEFETALENAGGTAQRVADTQMDTLDGQLRKLSAAWEEITLSATNSETVVGNALKNIVKGVVDAIEILNVAFGKIAFGAMDEFEDDSLFNGYKRFWFRLKALFSEETRELIKEANALSEEWNKSIEEGANKMEGANKNLADRAKEVIKVETDLIKIQEELLKLAKEMPGTTEKEVTARNKKIAVIEKEIQRLKELGKIEPPKASSIIDIDKITAEYEKGVDEMERLNEKELQDYLKKEEEKTKTHEKFLRQRQELEYEVQDKLKDLFGDMGNMFFDIEAEKYEKALEKNNEYYDGLLANEELSEEQRGLIEAQRQEKENEIKRRQRENEKKQFLFNQGMKVAEIMMDMWRRIAEIQATAALLAANPATAVFAKMALAQIPLVKLSSGISIASVLAQSVPQFDKGTDDAPELFIAGEKRPELMIDKRGRVSFIDKPTLFAGDEYKGSQIVGGAETAKLLRDMQRISNNMTLSDIGNSNGGEGINIDRLIDTIVASDKRSTERITNAIKGMKRNESTIERMRIDELKKRLKD